MMSPSQAREKLGEYKERIDNEIEQYFANQLSDAKKESPFTQQTIEFLRDYTLNGGKRLRAAFVYYAYIMMGGTNLDEIFKTSMFIELTQSYILIEDDIMDKSPLRRGHPTMHITWEKYHKDHFKKQDPAHFGTSLAINTGLLASHLALAMLAESNFPAEVKIDATTHVNKLIYEVGLGQIHDILLEVRDDVSESDVLFVHHHKTAMYTYELPILTGAKLAGANKEQLKPLINYSYNGGIAFQLQDDLLGMFGEEEKLGKPVDSDLKEGKQTILILKAFEKASKDQKAKLTHALGNQSISAKEVNEVRQILKETGSYEYNKQLALEYVRKAQDALTDFPDKNEGWEFLNGIAQYMIEREI